MWQQQPNEAAQIVSTVIKLTGSLDNRRSLLCRSFAAEAFCSMGCMCLNWFGDSHVYVRAAMFYSWQLRAPLVTKV